MKRLRGLQGLSRCVKGVLLTAMLATAPMSVALGQDAPKRGGTLNMIYDINIPSLDPLFGSAFGKDRKIFNLFYETLYYFNSEGKMVPELATSWEVAEDGLSLTAHLREGIRFSDGTAFDAEAVVKNIERVVDSNGKSRTTALADVFAGAEAVDDMTVRINFSRRAGKSITLLGTEAGMMVSPKAFADPEALRRNPVGTGPFVLKSWQGGTSLSAVRNDNYWRKSESGEPLPYLEAVNVRFITDKQVQLLEAKAGSVDISDWVDVKDFAEVVKNPSLELNSAREWVPQFMVFNFAQGPFKDNKALRDAVSFGINRQQLEKAIALGYGIVTPTWVAPTSWDYTEDLPAQVYDPEKARQLYTESGHSGPLTLSIIKRDPDDRIAQLVQAQLAAVGIPLKVEVLEREAWLEKTRSGSYEFALLRSSMLPDPGMRYEIYYAKLGGGYLHSDDETLVKLVEDGAAEVDIGTRQAIYRDLQKRLLDNTYEVFLFSIPAAEAINKRVHGLENQRLGIMKYAQVWLEQ